MESYIEQLIGDLHETTRKLKLPYEILEESEAGSNDEPEPEDMSYVEEYIEGEELPISQITGIDQEYLPPAEKLNTDQQALLAGELEKLLEYFHFVMDFPPNYPAHLRYSFIRNFWSQEHVALSIGESHIEFCEYEKENCPFPGYCTTCEEFETLMKSDEENG